MTCFCWPSLMLGLFGLSVNSLPTLIRPPYCTYIRILRNSCQQKYKHDPCRVSCLTSFSTISSLFKLLSCSLISISINQFENFPFLFESLCSGETNTLLQDKMRFYKGTDQYVVAVTAREEVMVWFSWVGLLSTKKYLNNTGWLLTIRRCTHSRRRKGGVCGEGALQCTSFSPSFLNVSVNFTCDNIAITYDQCGDDNYRCLGVGEVLQAGRGGATYRRRDFADRSDGNSSSA